MTPQIAILLAITVVTMALLALEWIEADVVALAMLITLTLTGLLPPDKAFAGFGSDTVIVILGLLILTAALLRTGVMDIAGRAILRRTGTDPERLLIVITVASAGLGAFMSNTASTAFFLPVVFGLAQRARISPAKLLMPLAFSSILTSSVTLISTSTNIVVSGILKDYKMAPMGMFELAPVGIPITIVGLIYLLTIGKRLIPDRFGPAEKDASYSLVVRPYLAEVIIQENSPLTGRTLEDSGVGRDLNLTVLRIMREGSAPFIPNRGTVLRAGDVLLVEGQSEEILKIKDVAGIDIKADVKFSEPGLSPEDLGFVEVILLPRSNLIGRTLKGYGFRERYGLQVLGVSRHGEVMHRKISDAPLRVGDILLVQGAREKIQAMQGEAAFRIIGALTEERPKVRLAPVAIAIFVGVLLVTSFKLMSVPVAVMLGCVAAFLTRCISSEQAYGEVEWKAIILIGAMLSLGAAMEETGAAVYLAGKIAGWMGPFGPTALLGAFFILTVALTQPMSNQAAAIVVLPVAIRTAYQLQLNPRSFAMMIAVAASCSYLTPLEPACLMVYGPGRYRFIDFLKVGSLLTLAIFVIAMLMVPRIWPLAAK